MIPGDAHRTTGRISPLIVLVMLWFISSSLISSLSTEAFTTKHGYHESTTRKRVPLSASRAPKPHFSQTTLAALPFLGVEEVTTMMVASSQQPPLDIIGVDPGQALFWCTIIHWILWDKTSTSVALTFDIVCIIVTLWDGTVRAAG